MKLGITIALTSMNQTPHFHFYLNILYKTVHIQALDYSVKMRGRQLRR